ncbi:hypothetical protein BBK36DRAFT_1158417 [Trichoderma citrinoviride]|uniref:Uncharacterized protein n=1 Tax=Trichoderma citrinoviride TaxID=58853 RepID=A0A2T4BE36_9HYPO|nr:hypothetical protein BBK36DRAFT_1158417 [Trichoderma citrinoviride]PTB67584.1 hypothetical protein BBK36DRAFT_1158417 [Trichoderma citrinoviride]
MTSQLREARHLESHVVIFLHRVPEVDPAHVLENLASAIVLFLSVICAGESLLGHANPALARAPGFSRLGIGLESRCLYPCLYHGCHLFQAILALLCLALFRLGSRQQILLPEARRGDLSEPWDHEVALCAADRRRRPCPGEKRPSSFLLLQRSVAYRHRYNVMPGQSGPGNDLEEISTAGPRRIASI